MYLLMKTGSRCPPYVMSKKRIRKRTQTSSRGAPRIVRIVENKKKKGKNFGKPLQLQSREYLISQQRGVIVHAQRHETAARHARFER